MLKLAAFLVFEDAGIRLVPYQYMMRMTAEDGVKDDIFPPGWEQQTDSIEAEVIDDLTKDLFWVTLFPVRGEDFMDVPLEIFEGLFKRIAKDVIVYYRAYGEVEYFHNDPHK